MDRLWINSLIAYPGSVQFAILTNLLCKLSESQLLIRKVNNQTYSHVTVKETVEIKHLKLAYGTYSTDIEPNSHLSFAFLLSCSDIEIWKAKIDPS